jgi:hypothetical protein
MIFGKIADHLLRRRKLAKIEHFVKRAVPVDENARREWFNGIAKIERRKLSNNFPHAGL